MLKLKISGTHDFTSSEFRSSIAKYLSTLIQGEVKGPWKQNASDLDWQLDCGNDWFLHYNNDEPEVIQITYRYQCATNNKEASLGQWLEVGKSLGEVVAE